MFKRMFALTSVTALAIVAGCSSSDDKKSAAVELLPPSEPLPDNTSKDDKKPSKKSDDGEERPEDEACMAKSAIDAASFPYGQAKQAPGSCTAAEADKLTAFFKKAVESNEDPNPETWAAEVSDTCAKCAFTPVDSTTWGPLLVKDSVVENVNMGGCIELVSGKPACGKAFQQYSDCQLNACLACEDQKAYESCIRDSDAIQDGPCHAATQAVIDDCGKEVYDYQKACMEDKTYAFQGPLDAMCVKGATKVVPAAKE